MTTIRKAVPPRAGGRYVGRYKGKLFRSVYEYSFYKHLEWSGLDVSGDDVEHEPFSVPYEVLGRSRSYFPDFLVRSQGVLYEVKSKWELGKRRGRLVREAKFSAARAFAGDRGLEFRVVTEDDFKVLPGRTALSDPSAVFSRLSRRSRRRSSKRSRKKTFLELVRRAGELPTGLLAVGLPRALGGGTR